MDDHRILRRYVLPRNNARDLGFTGKLLAINGDEQRLTEVGRLHPQSPDGSAEADRDLSALFQTASGKYICFHRRVQQGEFHFNVKIFQHDQIWQVQEFFLHNGVAGKQLLRAWGVNTIEELE